MNAPDSAWHGGRSAGGMSPNHFPASVSSLCSKRSLRIRSRSTQKEFNAGFLQTEPFHRLSCQATRTLRWNMLTSDELRLKHFVLIVYFDPNTTTTLIEHALLSSPSDQ